MQPRTATREKVLDHLVERQVSWSHIQKRIMEISETARPPTGVHFGPFITISRCYGAGGSSLAHCIAARLGWAVIGQEVVDYMAEHLKIDHNVLQQLDESGANWVRDLIGELMPTEIVGRDTYVTHLERVFKMTALHGKIIYVGRGAQFFLPRSCGLRIRLLADDEDCITRICEQQSLDRKQARKLIKERSEARTELVRRYFGADISDPLHYDLVLNSSVFTIEQLAAVVIHACRLRGLVDA
jgi:cytidylate kinase